MKTLSASLKAVVIASLACAAGLAAASDTQSLVVTATVKDVCKFASVPALSFNIDPSVPTSQAGTVSVTYNCTKGKTPAISATDGLTGRTLTGSAGTMAYDLTLGTLPTSTGFSATNAVDITATVLQAAYQDATAGAYTETVSLTIAP